MSDPPNVEMRLQAMERRLAEIQGELAPDMPPRRAAEPAPRGGAQAPPPAAAQAQAQATGPAQAPPPAVAVEMSAGPFVSIDALREFERAVSELPGVREVTVRGYESGNRAILEVLLDQETS